MTGHWKEDTPIRAAASFAEVGAVYAKYLADQYARNPDWEAQQDSWARRFGIRGHVLDAGCGLGHFARACERAGAAVVGVERDMTLLLNGRLYTGFQRVVRADVCGLPFTANSFDWILSNQVIEHVEEPGELLDESLRVLRPGGHLLISSPNRRVHLATRRPQQLWLALRGLARSDPTHVREFVPGELRKLLRKSGFDVKSEESVGRNAGWPLVRLFAGGILMLAQKPM